MLVLKLYESEKNQNPHVILKPKVDINKSQANTIIYDQFEAGIFSYIQNGKKCNTPIIKVILPEKSSFFVFWNKDKDDYDYLNVLDFNCEKIEKTISTIDTKNLGNSISGKIFTFNKKDGGLNIDKIETFTTSKHDKEAINKNSFTVDKNLIKIINLETNGLA